MTYQEITKIAMGSIKKNKQQRKRTMKAQSTRLVLEMNPLHQSKWKQENMLAMSFAKTS